MTQATRYNNMGKQQELDEIAKEIVAKQVCSELAATATQLVPGDGNADAEIVFIGEAPGKSEDAQGLPFVGAAGKFLNEMLASIGLSREDVFITNIVKYRPPNNRDPLPEEKAAFWPYLLRQLMVIKPKLVVTLGRHSMEYFLPNQRIGQIHGQPKRIGLRLGRQEIGDSRQVKTEQNSISHLPSPDSMKIERQGVAGHEGASAVQGDSEARTEPYEEYGEGALEQATQQRAASNGGVASSASEQAVASLVILPLFHPAAALYNGSLRATLLEDFAQIPAVLDLVKAKQIN